MAATERSFPGLALPAAALAAALAAAWVPAGAQMSAPLSGTGGSGWDGARNQRTSGVATDGLTPIGTGVAPAEGAPAATSTQRRTSITPGLWTQFTFSDNIDLRPRGQATNGTMFEVSPFVQAELNSPRAVGSVFYAARGLVYGGNTSRDNELRHDLRTNADFRITDQALRLNAQAYVFDVNRSPFSASSFDPGARSTSRTTYQRYDLSPYVVGRAGNNDYELRYRVSYVDPGEGFVSNIGNGVSFNAGTSPGASRIGWLARGDSARYAYDNGFDYTNSLVEVLGTWTPTPLVRFGAGVNYAASSVLADSEGRRSGVGPSAAVDWRPDPRTQLAARWTSTYYSNILSAGAAHQAGRVRLGLSYDRGIRDGNQAGLLYFDPTRLFATPSTSAAAVAANAASNPQTDSLATGGPTARDPATTVGTPLASGSTQSPIVQAESLIASLQLAATRSSVLLTAYLTNQRPALRVPGFDSETDLDTWGVQGRYDYRLDARTTAIVTAAYQQSSSDVTATEARLTGVTLGLRYQLTRQAAVLGSLRNTRQRAITGNATSYDENAVSVAGEYRF
ncbi:MAG: TIGR03016 family PEP-CTERM system-associated outer membrane protein [Burkholderiales bacterium]|nr:MAG: TIGR03016 family PEP-CTERM system-associated outer membrane protein [Burkholderiales bacterium]